MEHGQKTIIMNTATNLRQPQSETKSATKGSDLSNHYLREIFGTKEDFSTGVIKDITPDIARKLLERNINNRLLRKNHVDWLSKQMTLGHWQFTGDAIKINSDGVLIDKQHTLSAIVQSGTTQRFLVIGGLSDTAIEVLDTGLGRTAGDVLKMNGIPNANNLSAICRKVLAFRARAVSAAFGGVGGVKTKISEEHKDVISNHRIFEEVATNSAYSDACANASKFYDSSRILTVSQYGMLYFLFAEKSPDSAWEFLSKFANGVGLSADSPIYLLRQRLEKERDTRVRYSDFLKMYWFFTCWNKFRRGETIKVLQTPATIEIPELL